MQIDKKVRSKSNFALQIFCFTAYKMLFQKLLEAVIFLLQLANEAVALLHIVAQEVDDFVQAQHLFTIDTRSGKAEVARASMIAETISKTYEKLEVGTFENEGVVGSRDAARRGRTRGDVAHHSGFETDSPGTVAAKIEIEVETELRGEVVFVREKRILRTAVEVSPSRHNVGFDFEKTGLAFVTAEEIHQIDVEHGPHDGAGIATLLAIHLIVSVGFETETEDGSQLLAQFDTAGESAAIDEIFQIEDHGVIDTAREGHRPVVGESGSNDDASIDGFAGVGRECDILRFCRDGRQQKHEKCEDLFHSFIYIRTRMRTLRFVFVGFRVQSYVLVSNLPNYFDDLAEVLGHFAKKCYLCTDNLASCSVWHARCKIYSRQRNAA